VDHRSYISRNGKYFFQELPVQLNIIRSLLLHPSSNPLVFSRKSYLKKNKVMVNLDLSSKVQENLASPQQLNHVFLNLISNAIEAMTGTTGAKCETTVRKINIKTNLKIGNIIIKVADTGPGISDKDFDHIFDPFYTRKKQMGMGVGLSVCHGIIEDHNGTITARNLPDGGAVFTITLPVL